jgi:hypothetical protein
MKIKDLNPSHNVAGERSFNSVVTVLVMKKYQARPVAQLIRVKTSKYEHYTYMHALLQTIIMFVRVTAYQLVTSISVLTVSLLYIIYTQHT